MDKNITVFTLWDQFGFSLGRLTLYDKDIIDEREGIEQQLQAEILGLGINRRNDG